jgi:hypothetical protein
MDWPTFAVEMVKALAWPVATITGLIMLRKPIAGLIPLLQKLKYKDFELEFGRRVEEAKADAAAELPAPEVLALPSGLPDSMRELARVSPRAAVTEAWRQVEVAAFEAAKRNQVPIRSRAAASPTSVMRELASENVVDQGKVALFHDLRGLRNQAVHAPEFALSYDAALEYASLAQRLASYLESASRGDGDRPRDV